MIPSIVKIPVSVAQYLVVAVARGGFGAAAAVVHRFLPGDAEEEARSRTTTAPSKPAASPVVDITPPTPRVSAEPVTQPPAPENAPTPGATTTLADPAPATATPATVASAKRATARKGPAKTPAKKAPASATAAQKAVARRTPAKKAAPTKPAATLDEPSAPVEEDTVVYSSGPDVASTVSPDDIKGI
ncbi:MAG: hypothetical protein ABW004_05835 [Aeromicrobium sp.]